MSKIENEISSLRSLKQSSKIQGTSKFTAFYPTQDLKFEIFQNAANSKCEKNPCAMLKNFAPVKKKAIRENFRKMLISFPWKKNPPVKKSEKVSVKILDRPWKVRKKCAWKRLCHPWKKPKKGRKWLSRALLIFTGKKKNTDKQWVVGINSCLRIYSCKNCKSILRAGAGGGVIDLWCIVVRVVRRINGW